MANLIDLKSNDDYHKSPNIEEIYNYIEKEINNNKNEITCIYYKRNKDGINLLHDFKNDFSEEIINLHIMKPKKI